MIDLRKFVVASNADDALLFLGAWQRHAEIREAADGMHGVFDDREAAGEHAAGLIRRAEEESPFGCKVPCDEHSRCVGFHPQVWRVQMSVKPVTGD